MSNTSPNPNGSIPIVFTYGGTALSNKDVFNAFYVTLPGGGGVELGTGQAYGYDGSTGNEIALGTSYSFSKAASPITDLLPTNAAGDSGLQSAFTNWAATQAASAGQTSYANLYLSHYTGGRIYLSNGNLGLGPTGEPVPASPSDESAYGMIYGIFEPYIGAQIGSASIPGNGADITDIDWFSFPLTLRTWYYDFDNPGSDLTSTVAGSTTVENGGDGSNIEKSLLISGPPTNSYPNASLPTGGGSSQGTRLVGPPAAAAPQSYYTDPAQDPFPYHYFDGYLTYLASAQGNEDSLFTLTGKYGGSGAKPPGASTEAQTFTLKVDFRQIKTETFSYPSGDATKITPASTLVLTGSTDELGDLTITIPWAKGQASYQLKISQAIKAADDAIAQGWLAEPAAAPTAQSGTYSPVVATAQNKTGREIPPQNQTVTQLQLIFSVNSDPLSGTLDDLYQGGKGSQISLTGSVGLTLDANAVYTHPGDGNTSAVITITADANGKLAEIQINDLGNPADTGAGSTWTMSKGTTGLGNNQEFVVTLVANPPLRNAFILNSATYLEEPSSLSMTPGSGEAFKLDVESAGMAAPGWLPDTQWTTLSQPAGIYGANAGYTISGITGANSDLNGNADSLQNDVFGWIVADLLAALNTGLVGAPVTYPPTGKSIGDSSEDWFKSGKNPYTLKLWGGAAWAGQAGSGGKPITNFWNTWAYDLFTVPGGTDAYGFAFTDRFEEGILLDFNPPPAHPKGLQPVLLEAIIGDSPLLTAALKS